MKYHALQGATGEQAGRMLFRVPADMQGAGGPIRRFSGEHLWVTNFKGSEDLAAYRKKIVWVDVEGVKAGLIPGLFV